MDALRQVLGVCSIRIFAKTWVIQTIVVHDYFCISLACVCVGVFVRMHLYGMHLYFRVCIV